MAFGVLRRECRRNVSRYYFNAGPLLFTPRCRSRGVNYRRNKNASLLLEVALEIAVA